MNNLSIKTYLKKDKVHHDGTVTIFTRIILNRKIKLFTTGVRVLPKNWNYKTLKVRSSDYEYIFKNALIEAKVQQFKEVYLLFVRKNIEITLLDFDKELQHGTFKDQSFYEFVIKEIGLRALSSETKRTYTSQITKLEKFKTNLNIKEVDFNFIQSYKDYMISVLGNKKTTYYKSLGMFKTFTTWAREKELTNNKPFKNIPIQKPKGERVYLNESELGLLEQLLNDDKLSTARKEVLQYFLFSCYTGLRYRDVKELRAKDFYHEIIDKQKVPFISVAMHKTGDAVSIPLIKEAQGLYDLSDKIEYQKVFRVRCTTVTNRRLRAIIAMAGIGKHITFHCSRHTFATVGLERGLTIDMISNILGHRDLKTTQIYAKITQANKFKQLGKLR